MALPGAEKGGTTPEDLPTTALNRHEKNKYFNIFLKVELLTYT